MAQATYWVGQDGNIYFGSGGAGAGVQNLGSANDWINQQGNLHPVNMSNPAAKAVADGVGALVGVQQIADPATSGGAGAGAAPSNPTGATHPVLNQGAVTNTQKTIDQIAPLLQAALASEDQTFANTNNTFDQQEQQQRGTYDASTTTNQQNYDANFMDSIRAGIKGLGGLMNILRGTGAAGGTVDDQVRDVVGGTTADDIRTGRDTHDANQGQLDSSIASFLTDLKGKRQANADTHTNNARSITRDSNTQLQDLYSKMAGFYGDAGDTGNANSWMAKAGDLTPTIAANTAPHTSAYDTAPVVIHAPNLTSFAAPSQPDVASVPADGQVGSGIFAITNKRKDAAATPQNPVAVPVAQGA